MAENQNPTEQQTYKQHPIPQNVMQVEFKLIGGLTLRQFSLLAIFGVIAFLIYSSGLPYFIRTPLAVLLALGGAFVSLVPIQDRPADVWLKNFLVAISFPTERVWRKNPANLDVFFELREAHTIIKEEKNFGGPLRPREEVSQYLRQSLRESGDTLDLAESEFLKSIQLLQSDVELPAGLSPEIKRPAAPSPLGREGEKTETFEKRQEVEVTPTLASEVNFSEEKVIALPTTTGGRQKFFAPIQNIRAGRRLKLTRPAEVGSPIVGEKQVAAPAAPTLPEILPAPTGLTPSAPPLIQRVSQVNQKIEEAMNTINQKSEIKDQKVNMVAPEPAPTQPLAAPNPESKSPEDRPDSSTARLDPAGLARQAGQIASLSEELERLREEKLKLAEEVEKQKRARLEAETYATLAAEYQKQIGDLSRENQRFSQEGKKAQADLRRLQEAVSLESTEKESYLRSIKESQKRIDELAREKTQATDNLLNLQRELRELRLKQRFPPPPPGGPTTTPSPRVGPAATGPKPVPFVKDRANIVNGYVKGKDGRLLKNAIIIIKDQQGEPVRALKTNDLGQFAITTPVQNGAYSLEVSFIGETFDIMAVEAFGTVLDPLEIVGR